MADNIFILMTFADGKRANCIDALNKNDVLKTCQRRLKINNSAFTDDPMDKDMDDEGEFDRLFWDMGMKCFDKFFRSLEEVRPKQLKIWNEIILHGYLKKIQYTLNINIPMCLIDIISLYFL